MFIWAISLLGVVSIGLTTTSTISVTCALVLLFWSLLMLFGFGKKIAFLWLAGLLLVGSCVSETVFYYRMDRFDRFATLIFNLKLTMSGVVMMLLGRLRARSLRRM